MRPGNQSNKRMRGRGRKGPNPLTRTYESNGPDVKIRGTAMHVAEKYQQLARDAQVSGDRVMFESYNQHAEHYLRIVAAAQPQQQPATQQHARNEAEEGGESAAANGAAPPPVNGSERPAQEQRATPDTPDGDVVDANSPQPFIEDMPVIDQEGQVNGAGQNTEADEAGGEDKPRRRTRTPRPRTPRRAATEASAEAAPEAAAETADTPAATAETPATTAETPAATAEDEQTKPRRRTTRTRRAKTADEAPAEATATSE
ncbi:DUF4167 domain-containing protein [Labrenzia sp. DG1229]|uniref:DUF4167 domain-containing protein n=1 Tax=Labrenzia sp. DG1229 TaxID=681847 RepID=UPI000A055C7F|nr:DUF4167 domain-containing protein [Labrenzia sp. DG1229]